MAFTITRTSDVNFSVVTPTLMMRGQRLKDAMMRLDGNVLRSYEMPGLVRIAGLVRITLGPVALAKVQALRVGEAVELGE